MLGHAYANLPVEIDLAITLSAAEYIPSVRDVTVGRTKSHLELKDKGGTNSPLFETLEVLKSRYGPWLYGNLADR